MVKRKELDDVWWKVDKLWGFHYASRGIGCDHIKRVRDDGSVQHLELGVFIDLILDYLGLEVVDVAAKTEIRKKDEK